MTDNEIAKSIYLAANQGIPVIKLATITDSKVVSLAKIYAWNKGSICLTETEDLARAKQIALYLKTTTPELSGKDFSQTLSKLLDTKFLTI